MTDDDLTAAVFGTIETQIRPLLALHGGGIELIEITPTGEVRLAFEGACCGCALKSVTYALGVRQKLLAIPGVTEVTVEGIRLSRFALERAATMYGRHTPWVGQPNGSPASRPPPGPGSAHPERPRSER